MNFLDKRNKIEILQERAAIYNKVQDELYDKEVPDYEHTKLIKPVLDQHIEEFTTQQPPANLNSVTKSLPKPPVSVLTTSALISLGLDNYGTMTTQMQDVNRKREEDFNNYKQLKKEGRLEELVKPLKQQREKDKATQAILFKVDHIKDYEDKTHTGYKQQKSAHRTYYVIDETMKQMINEPNIKNHLMKNDLNTFFDSYLKHKNTLRGAVKQPTRAK
ncbi:unnamed protein product [Paramecium sonneborni]|uniref:Uncharacterized protein n=1 Tax=Paramecium sonneborni TaxID=65129 RepID=A0A8S1PJH0_9CILI|nr:unnamed protein product [Paramecium sonneborni]